MTVNLWSFLADGNGPAPNIPLKSSNWADDVEDDHGKSEESSLSQFEIDDRSRLPIEKVSQVDI